MLQKWEVIPDVLYNFLLPFCSPKSWSKKDKDKRELFLFLCLINKNFYKRYQVLNQPWFDKFSSRFSYFSKAGNYKVQFWEERYKRTLIEEGVHKNEEVIRRYEESKSNGEETIASIFDKINLRIVESKTEKTFFNYLIYYAASKKDQDLLDYLYGCLSKINRFQIHSNSITMLHYAALCNQVDVVEDLIKSEPSWDSSENFEAALYSFHSSIYKTMRHENSPEFIGSPLHIACRLGYREIVKIFLSAGIINPYNYGRETPFCCAIKGGHRTLFPLLSVLIQQLVEEKLGSPLYFAIENEDQTIFDELIKMGFRGDWKTYYDLEYLSPLHLAAMKRDPYFLNRLMKQKDININSNLSGYAIDIFFPLDAALKMNNVENFHLLYTKGANLAISTPLLHEAARHGKIGILRYLVDELEKKSTFFEGMRPIHTAVYYGHAKAVEFFLNRKEPIDIKDEKGDTPFILAARYQRYGVLQFLFEKNIDLNQKGAEGMTALHHLVYYGYKDAMLEKKKSGMYSISYRVTDNQKNLPNCSKYINELIREGASIVVRDESNHTVCDDLIKWKRWELIQLAYDKATENDKLIIEKKLKNSGVHLTPTHSIEVHKKKKQSSPKSSSSVQKQKFSNPHDFEEKSDSCFDFAHPPLIVWIISAFIPVLGWGYLFYLIINALFEWCEREDDYSFSL